MSHVHHMSIKKMKTGIFSLLFNHQTVITISTVIHDLAITGCICYGLLAGVHILEAILWRKQAANQSFYNLVFAVGLIWALAEIGPSIMLFFLSIIFTVGIFGTITLSKSILFIQIIPALYFIYLCWLCYIVFKFHQKYLHG
jgi:glucose dehydrogenase